MKFDVVSVARDFKSHWKQPAEGKYLSYKEFAAYSVGGIGVSSINTLFGSYIAMTASSVLLGSVYGLRPTHIALLSIIINIVNFIKSPLISMLLDNTNSKHGKFRPYLLYTGVPTVILLNALVFLPVDAEYNLKLVLIGVTYTILLLFQSVYALAYTSIAQVITPNGQERTTLMSIGSVIFNFGPSVINFLFPTLAALLWGGMTNITTYRFLFPIFSIFGIILSMWVFTGTKERIIVPKDYVAKVRFIDGVKQISNNKYFWQITFYQILGALKGGLSNGAINWYFIYVLGDEKFLGVFYTILGTASLPGMLLAPILIKKLGKRNVVIFSNLLHAIFLFFMVFALDNPLLLIVLHYLNTLALGMDAIITQAMTADVFDYQQWKTGTRLEGFITQFSGMLIIAFTTVLNLIVPFFFEYFGLKDNYDVLYDAAVRTPVFNVLIISSVISSVLCIIPVLFYDLTEKKQEEYIEDLKSRKKQEEYIEDLESRA